MKGYEQLEFEETRANRQYDVFTESALKCFDSNGNEIKVGDYVVAVSGEAKAKCIEGIVVKIFSDGVICDIMVSTLGGKVLECNGNPSLYEVVTNENY